MYHVKCSDRGLLAGRCGGPRARDVLGAHVAACPYVRSYIPAHGQREGGRGGGFARGLISVLRGSTSFHAYSAADPKLAAYAASMTL